MSRTPLGEVCIALGLMRPDDVATVTQRLRVGERARFGDLALELGLLDDEALARALAHQFRLNMVPSDRLVRIEVPEAVLALVPVGLVRERLLVPTFLDEENRVLSLLTADPTDIPSLRAAQHAARAARLRLFVAPRSGMRALVERLVGAADDSAPSVDSAGIELDAASLRSLTIVFEPDTERASALRRLEAFEGLQAEIVGDPEQVSAFVEANQADRVFFRRAVYPVVDPYVAAWKNARPLLSLCPVEGFGPAYRNAIPYEETREFFFALLTGLLPAAPRGRTARRTLAIVRGMAAGSRLPVEHRDAVVLAGLVWGLAASARDDGADAAAIDEAGALLRAVPPPYDVRGILEALGPRVRGETGPGASVGAEFLFTAWSVAQLPALHAVDPVAALGAQVTRHFGPALAALAAAFEGPSLRDALAPRGSGEDSADASLPGIDAPVDVDAPAVGLEEPAGDGGSFLDVFRRVFRGLGAASPAPGALPDSLLPDVLNGLVLGARSARVLVGGVRERGEVHLLDGRIVGAAYGAATGESALRAMLGLAHARVELGPAEEVADSLDGRGERLVQDALRRRDGGAARKGTRT